MYRYISDTVTKVVADHLGIPIQEVVADTSLGEDRLLLIEKISDELGQEYSDWETVKVLTVLEATNFFYIKEKRS